MCRRWLSYDPLTHDLHRHAAGRQRRAPIVIPVTVDDGKGGVIAINVTITPVEPGAGGCHRYDGHAVPDARRGRLPAPTTPIRMAIRSRSRECRRSIRRRARCRKILRPAPGLFTPANGFVGTATITYTIQDQDGATASSTHDVVVAAPARPVAINDYYSTGYLTPMAGDVRTGDTFVAGSAFSVLSQPMNGTLSRSIRTALTPTRRLQGSSGPRRSSTRSPIRLGRRRSPSRSSASRRRSSWPSAMSIRRRSTPH